MADRFASRLIIERTQLLNVEQNVMTCQWQADQLFAEAFGLASANN